MSSNEDLLDMIRDLQRNITYLTGMVHQDGVELAKLTARLKHQPGTGESEPGDIRFRVAENTRAGDTVYLCPDSGLLRVVK